MVIEFSVYPCAKGNGLIEDYAVTGYYPNAVSIYKYVRSRKPETKEKIMDFIGILDIIETVDKWKNSSIFYLVEQGGRQFSVNITKEFIISKRLVQQFDERKLAVIENNDFIRLNQKKHS